MFFSCFKPDQQEKYNFSKKQRINSQILVRAFNAILTPPARKSHEIPVFSDTPKPSKQRGFRRSIRRMNSFGKSHGSYVIRNTSFGFLNQENAQFNRYDFSSRKTNDKVRFASKSSGYRSQTTSYSCPSDGGYF